MVALGLPPYQISVFWLSIRNADINFFILHKYGNKHYTFAVVPTIYISLFTTGIPWAREYLFPVWGHSSASPRVCDPQCSRDKRTELGGDRV